MPADQEKVGTIWDHLNELSVRMRWVFYSLIATTVFFMTFPANASFLQNPLAFYDPLIALVLKQVVRDVLPSGVTLIAGEITAPLEIYLVGSFVLGIAASTPIIAYQVYRYVDPALYPEERGAIAPFTTSFTVLFLIGAVFGYKILALEIAKRIRRIVDLKWSGIYDFESYIKAQPYEDEYFEEEAHKPRDLFEGHYKYR